MAGQPHPRRAGLASGSSLLQQHALPSLGSASDYNASALTWFSNKKLRDGRRNLSVLHSPLSPHAHPPVCTHPHK